MTAKSSPICVDSSVIVRVLTGTAQESTLDAWSAWEDRCQPFVAPALIHYELCNSLHQYTRKDILSPAIVDELITTALALPIVTVDDDQLHMEALDVARRFGIGSVYDAHFLSLAERLGIELITADARLYERVGKRSPWIRLME
jgi:predicted nucleic acid-binding protein